MVGEKYLSKNILKQAKVINDEENIQMPLLQKHRDDMERIPDVNQRQSQTAKVQQMRKEIHLQEEGQK